MILIKNYRSKLGGCQVLLKRLYRRPCNLFAEVPNTELQEVLKIWQNAFEWSYYDEVLAGVQHLAIAKKDQKKDEQNFIPSFQALFCIDERECSLRMHVENVEL